MSALGDRIIAGGPYVANVDEVPFELVAAEWNALRQELIDLRARAAVSAPATPEEWEGYLQRRSVAASGPPAAGGLRPCPICREVKIGPSLVECSSCAGREDAAAKRQADQ